MIAKGKTWLFSEGQCPYDNIYWFNQKEITFLADGLTKVNLEKESVLVLCRKMEKLRNFDMFKTPTKDWKKFMSNDMFLPRLDFESLRIDKKSPIIKEDFILSQKGPLENSEKY